MKDVFIRRLPKVGVVLWVVFLLVLILGPAASQAAPPPPSQPTIYSFGRPDCPACRKMKEVLGDLQGEFRGKMEVIYFSFQNDESLFKRYKVVLIPTQVFLDPAGQEIFRQEGLMSKENLLNKLRELKFIKD